MNGSTPIRIRQARLSDATAIEDLYRQLHERDYSSPGPLRFQRALQRVITDRNERILVAVVGRQVVGCIHILIFRHLGRALHPAAIVENVVVDRNQRRLGIGKRLLDAAVGYARNRNCYKAALTSGLPNTSAHGFYERAGWQWKGKGFKVPLVEFERRKH